MSALTEALESLAWCTKQEHGSVSLKPGECRALLARIEQLEEAGEGRVASEAEEWQIESDDALHDLGATLEGVER